MADEANDVKDQAVAQDAATTEPSAVENNAPEVTDDIAELWEDAEGSKPKPGESKPKQETEGDPAEEKPEEDQETSSDDTPEANAEETDTEEQPRGKQDANSRIRQLANENRDLRRQIQEANAHAYRTQTPEELADEGFSETDAKVEAMRQEMEVDRYNQQVVEVNNTFNSEAENVLRDFPMFDPDSDQYKPEIAQRAQALYLKSAGISMDPNTKLVNGVQVLPYEFYKTFAETYQASATEHQIKGQKATEGMLARVDAPAGVTPKQPKKDPIAAIWESDD